MNCNAPTFTIIIPHKDIPQLLVRCLKSIPVREDIQVIVVDDKIIRGTAVTGWASLILSIWLVGGFMILSIGIAGMYIGNIYNEVKRRPLYHIQEILK